MSDKAERNLSLRLTVAQDDWLRQAAAEAKVSMNERLRMLLDETIQAPSVGLLEFEMPFESWAALLELAARESREQERCVSLEAFAERLIHRGQVEEGLKLLAQEELARTSKPQNPRKKTR